MTTATDQPGSDTTTDAECAGRIPDRGLRHPPLVTSQARGGDRPRLPPGVGAGVRRGPATAPATTSACETLDRTGGVSPGAPVDWLGDNVVACAVEPAGDVGQTKVIVQGEGDEATQITIAVLSSTTQERVRAAVAELVGTS